MTLKLEPHVRGSHYPSPDGVTRRLATALNRSLAGVHQLLDGPTSPFARVEQILTIAVHAGHTAWAAARLERLSRVVRQARVPLTAALIEQAATVDAEEDVSLTRFAGERSAAHKDELLRRLDREILAKMALRDALAGEETL